MTVELSLAFIIILLSKGKFPDITVSMFNTEELAGVVVMSACNISD